MKIDKGLVDEILYQHEQADDRYAAEMCHNRCPFCGRYEGRGKEIFRCRLKFQKKEEIGRWQCCFCSSMWLTSRTGGRIVRIKPITMEKT